MTVKAAESEHLLDEALAITRESKSIEFKRSFDIESSGEWCEIIKDIVAIANSGGGFLLIGLENDGSPSGTDTSAFLLYDSAKILVFQISTPYERPDMEKIPA